MRTYLLIVILLIFNITYSQTDTVKQSKVSINVYYVGNIQTVDKNKYPDARNTIYNYINGKKVYAGYYDIDYKTTFLRL